MTLETWELLSYVVTQVASGLQASQPASGAPSTSQRYSTPSQPMVSVPASPSCMESPRHPLVGTSIA